MNREISRPCILFHLAKTTWLMSRDSIKEMVCIDLFSVVIDASKYQKYLDNNHTVLITL